MCLVRAYYITLAEFFLKKGCRLKIVSVVLEIHEVWRCLTSGLFIWDLSLIVAHCY